LMDRTSPYETVTKLQAAERQLRVAVRLFFERRDLVAVHTLVAAAQGVLRDLGRPRGFKSIFEGSSLIRPECRNDLGRLFKRAQNFFKHADSDADAQLEFYYEATKFYLLDAALLYNQLTERQFPEITGLLAWFSVKLPDLLVEGPFKREVQSLISEGANSDDFQLFLDVIDLYGKK